MQLHMTDAAYSLADTVARYALIVLSFLLPAFIIPVAWAAVPQSKMLLIAISLTVAVVAWWIARTSESTLLVPRMGLIGALALLPIAYFIASVAAGWTSVSLVGLGVEQDTLSAMVVWFALAALTACILAGRPNLILQVVRSLILGITIVMVFQLLYAIFPNAFSLGLLAGNTANIIGSWHDLGILAVFALFASIGLLSTNLFAGWWRIVLGVLAVASFALIILVHFSDLFWGMFALALAASIYVFRSRLIVDGHHMRDASLAVLPWVIVAALFLGLGLIGPRVVDWLPSSLQITQVEVRPSWQGTFDVAKQSLSAPTSVMFGTGPNSFTDAWGQFKPRDVNQTPFWDADFNLGVGIVPTSLMSAGVFGLIAWAAVALALAGIAVRFALENRAASDHRTLIGIVLASVIFFLVFHFIYTPGHVITVIMLLLIGILVAIAGDARMRALPLGVTDARSAATLTGTLVLALAVVISSGLIVREIASNLYVNNAAYAFQTTQDIGRATAKVQTAISVSSKNDRAHRAAAELGLIQLAQLAQNADPNNAEAATQLQAALQSTIQHALSAVTIDDSNYQNWLSLAGIYSELAGVQVEGALDSAMQAYMKAAEANPSNPTPRIRLAQLAMAQNNLDAASQHLTEAIALKPDLALAHYMRSQVAVARNNGDEAVAAAAEAVRLVPQEPLAWFNLGYILFLGGVYQDAGIAFEKAVEVRSDYSNALYMLALTYYQLQLTDNAVAAMVRVAELNPSETWIGAVVANMRAGKPALEGIATAGQ